jgi:hypothetical protein
MCLAYLLTVILSKFCENTNHFFPNFAKYLHGITFQLTNKSTYPRCFKRHKVTLNIDLLLWTKRNLTILGKILITKSLIVPIFTYVASACVVPEKK